MEKIINQNFDFKIDDLSSSEQMGLYKYWLKIKDGQSMPSRIDFDPMAVPRSLPYIIMEDVLYDPVRFRVRLIGSKCRTHGKFLGKIINDFEEMDHITALLINAVKVKKPYYYQGSFRANDNLIREYSSLVLPFSEDGEEVNIFMGCLYFLAV